MRTGSKTDWKQELAIADWGPPTLFSDPSELATHGQPVPQAHALRRAFEELKLNAILCLRNAPVVYFREVDRIEPAEVKELHRRFWSQGLSPVLVLIAPTDVYIYSGLARPSQESEALPGVGQDGGLVAQLNRVKQAAELRQLVLSLESGEFFRCHARSFDRNQRVDRELLRNLQDARDEMKRLSDQSLDATILDAVLCRVIFACYLFDRKVIDEAYLLEDCGITDATDLRGILRLPKREAGDALYKLFEQLATDFNGDLFRDDLAVERRAINNAHLTVLDRFLRGADVRSGQGSFWPYDFGVIPIETISAIYEHFLKAGDAKAKKKVGAFYTPRFLCEVVLDLALEGTGSLLDKRFLDPSCGSGIFLVGLFNRLAEEWKRKNPAARYDGRAKGLMSILTGNLFGADSDPTACRITAFSLYLAFLDQMSPPDIRKLQRKGRILPPLVFGRRERDAEQGDRSIFHGDFFESDESMPSDFDFVVGNPPWASETNGDAPLVRWCHDEKLPLPDSQKAIAFVWKAPRHLAAGGRACLILPHGVLFNHGPVSLRFQQAWLAKHAMEVVLNLADFRWILFEEAVNPALIVRYRKEPPCPSDHVIHYRTPKMDWNIKAELLTIYPQDQKLIRQADVSDELTKGEVPLVWKERYWGTPRDSKLLDRLREFPELGKIVGHNGARWQIAQGFQEPGPSDGPDDRKSITLPTRNLIKARGKNFRLFLLESDCEKLPSATLTVRSKSNTNTDVYHGPHVLITDGFKVAFAKFDAAFHQSVRGIRGPAQDMRLLIFLSAYLNSPVARYILFHTGSNIGVERPKAEAGDVLRLPFPLPADSPAGDKADQLIDRANAKYRWVVTRSSETLANRQELFRSAMLDLANIVYEYFNIDANERMLIEDTNTVLFRSMQPTQLSERIPTLRASRPEDRATYGTIVCDVLNDLARGGQYKIHFSVETDQDGGVAVAIFSKMKRGSPSAPVAQPADGFFPAFKCVQQAFRKKLGTFELLRGVKVFEKDRLFILKPLSQRFWTWTAALNDADEIAAAILSRSVRGNA